MPLNLKRPLPIFGQFSIIRISIRFPRNPVLNVFITYIPGTVLRGTFFRKPVPRRTGTLIYLQWVPGTIILNFRNRAGLGFFRAVIVFRHSCPHSCGSTASRSKSKRTANISGLRNNYSISAKSSGSLFKPIKAISSATSILDFIFTISRRHLIFNSHILPALITLPSTTANEERYCKYENK